MSVWDELIAESKRLEERASKIQDGESVGLSQEEIETLIANYYVWYGNCLAVLPKDLRSDFRSEYDGTFFTPKIKKFLEAPTKPDKWRPSDRRGREIWPYWAYPYEKTFSPYIRSQRNTLVKASKRPQKSDAISKVDKGKEELSPDASQPQSTPQRHTRKRWVPVFILFISLASILIYVLSSIFNSPLAGIIVGVATILAAVFTMLGPIQADNNGSTKSLKELLLHYTWRNSKTKLATIIVAGIFILALVVALFNPLCIPNPNSTPQGTITSFCNALVQRDYQGAYNQLSSGVKSKINEGNWSRQVMSEYNRATSCNVIRMSSSDSLASGTVQYVFQSTYGLDYDYDLHMECGEWRISGY